MDKIKVIQWFTWEIARHRIRVIATCPTMELVGAFVFHMKKPGTANKGSPVATIKVRFLLGDEQVPATVTDVVRRGLRSGAGPNKS